MSEENARGVRTLLTRWFTEIWNNKRIEVAAEMATRDVEWNDFITPNVARVGLDAYRADFAAFHEAIRDFKLDVIDVIADDLRGAFAVTGQGVLIGAQLGPRATNEPIVLTCMGLTWHEPKTFKIKRAINHLVWQGVNAADFKTVA